MSCYCQDCAIRHGVYRPAIPAALTATHYQLEKYLKHTAPTTWDSFHTIFTGPSSEAYQRYIITAVASGYVEVDVRSRVNIVWVASEQTGIAYRNGAFEGPAHGVKVVWPGDANRLHGFPIVTSSLSVEICAICSRQVPR